MAEGRQHSEWGQVLFLNGTIGNLFAERPADLRKLVPPHVLGPEPKCPEPTAKEIEANWKMLTERVRRGRAHGR
jgi:hypothetical protein